jgi:amidase
VAAVVEVLAERLGPPSEVAVHDGDPAAAIAAFGVVQAREFAEVYGAWLRTARPRLGPTVRDRIARALEVDRRSAERARSALSAWAERLRARLPSGTVLVLPTAPCPPPSVGAPVGELDAFRTRALAVTVPASAAGLPQVSVAVPGPDGPLGVSLVGPRGTDRDLLALAASLAGRRPAPRPQPTT